MFSFIRALSISNRFLILEQRYLYSPALTDNNFIALTRFYCHPPIFLQNIHQNRLSKSKIALSKTFEWYKIPKIHRFALLKTFSWHISNKSSTLFPCRHEPVGSLVAAGLAALGTRGAPATAGGPGPADTRLPPATKPTAKYLSASPPARITPAICRKGKKIIFSQDCSQD